MNHFKAKHIKNIVFDADGTLLEEENPYLRIARHLEVENVVRNWVKEYLDHKVSYQALVDKETELFITQYKRLFKKHPQQRDLEKLIPPVIIKQGVKETIAKLQKRDINIYVLSSGFLYMVEDLNKVGILLENIHANRFLYDTRGDFVMIKIDVTGEKIGGFVGILKERHLNIEKTAYVGDNAFDKTLIEYILKNDGNVLFVKEEGKKFALKNFPKHKNFQSISSVNEIPALL
jgi:phosphoserine phosphatase